VTRSSIASEVVTVTEVDQVARALTAAEASVRLRAAQAAGTRPEPSRLGLLVERCGTEPDFFVRDMLTWALGRHDRATVLERVAVELGSARPTARSQALHTLSKLGDGTAWPLVTDQLLTDPDDEVARAAWRAAVVLVPDGERDRLARTLVGQLGRGDAEVRLSLSRALLALGEAAASRLVALVTHPDAAVRAHVAETGRLRRDPGTASRAAVAAARRAVALHGAPVPPTDEEAGSGAHR
jgi:HEAT repeat protein